MTKNSKRTFATTNENGQTHTNKKQLSESISKFRASRKKYEQPHTTTTHTCTHTYIHREKKYNRKHTKIHTHTKTHTQHGHMHEHKHKHISWQAFAHTNIHTAKQLRNILLFSMTQMVECSLTMWEVLGSKPSWVCVFVVVDVGAIFSIFRKWCKKSFFSKNKLSGDIGLMVQMLNLNFVAAAVSNYWENLFLLKMEKGA